MVAANADTHLQPVMACSVGRDHLGPHEPGELAGHGSVDHGLGVLAGRQLAELAAQPLLRRPGACDRGRGHLLLAGAKPDPETLGVARRAATELVSQLPEPECQRLPGWLTSPSGPGLTNLIARWQQQAGSPGEADAITTLTDHPEHR